jgi:hypothetical protein
MPAAHKLGGGMVVVGKKVCCVWKSHNIWLILENGPNMSLVGFFALYWACNNTA